ncbi:(E)-4-hydroxy-3-methylbut-2-enyl-diphosphate synthase [Acidiluteibacter ferrifornacis]|uniref:4-hydroxy-3-methylbut-2-en-1-yl diphosphate synthase (flavodoxin) n=1 Tax=Acidiluteibacter ferrifornacis TaxID=2692424 RepID=A0A6N9NMJ7_9FLAO|nr:(E)-4-hydroxy-3-methylbut-2-enyl-diphosphate synthase [Acidiluteibacter ferrifornacis]NBG67193.1 (E)-4-hydroxy-3-methylbut-2-enyl-diphosphate synthase [Acidiluteibacter ferrifornacis]
MSNYLPSNHYYVKSLTQFNRVPSREVTIGEVPLGGTNPIRIQSMTTTDTMDTEKTVAQSIRMIEAGCEYVRITAPSKKEAENLRAIKEALRAKGHKTPLVADIHFTPNAAEIAARIIEKVRVNPGNYADKKKFENIDYTDETYQKELERIEERFTPLVKICKEENVAMRIGTNHGSLSDRILSRYGDTPVGMVESALEFLRICEKHDFKNIVLSMKASNTQVMVQAYRLLLIKMAEEGMNYPLHLGVTEAGDGEDGRIKSAVGIGTLLEDGIGDTIRVSLTEEPEAEIPVAKALAERYEKRKNHKPIPPISINPINPYEYKRRASREVVNIGGKHHPIVFGDLSGREKITAASLFPFGYNYSVSLDKYTISDLACDYIFIGNNTVDFEIPGTLGLVTSAKNWQKQTDKPRLYPLFSVDDYLETDFHSPQLNFINARIEELSELFMETLENDPTAVLVIETDNEHGMAEQRRMFIELINNECSTPVIIKRSYNDLTDDKFQLYSATDFGALLIDGLGDGIWIDANNCGSKQFMNSTAFGILQATRTRISKTEYISCPSCGRTLFDLQETTAKIRAKTNHLKGVKIGIMGCIVNGPGEMADADYGYVGTGPGKITLYKEKEVVRKNVPELEAVDALIDLIKQHGDWVEI